MSIEEAKEIVDVVLESLVEMRKLSPQAHGTMTTDQMNEIAEAVKAKSEE